MSFYACNRRQIILLNLLIVKYLGHFVNNKTYFVILLFNEETAVMCCLFLFTLAQTIKAQLLMFNINPDLKTTKDMFKKIYIVLILGSALACKAAPSKPAKV